MGEPELLQSRQLSSAAVSAAAELAKHERPSLQSKFRSPDSVTEKTWQQSGKAFLAWHQLELRMTFSSSKATHSLLRKSCPAPSGGRGEIALSLIFDYPTIGALAAQIDDRAGTAAAQRLPYEEGVTKDALNFSISSATKV